MLVVGSIAARIGIRGLVAGGMFLYVACFASWIVLDSPLLIIATRVVTGFAFAGLAVGSAACSRCPCSCRRACRQPARGCTS